MAPVVKIMSQSGFIYEKNNFIALVEKNEAHSDYHKMMDFIKNCKLSYAMLEAPTIYCEVVEEIWTTAEFNSIDMTISFTLKGLVITNENNKLKCWAQEKRVLADLLRMDLNSSVPLVYLPIMNAPQVGEVIASTTPTSSNPSISLSSSVAMKSVSMPQQISTKVTKSKLSKSKTKKTTSVVSQKTTVVTTTINPEGSDQGVSGEGRGEHQRNPQDKEGKLSASQASQATVSQKAVVVEKVTSISLAASSQKDVTIENSSQPVSYTHLTLPTTPYV